MRLLPTLKQQNRAANLLSSLLEETIKNLKKRPLKTLTNEETNCIFSLLYTVFYRRV